MVEFSFFSLSPEVVLRLESYADVPESSYVDLVQCPSIQGFREFATLLGCDPGRTFQLVREIPNRNASILSAGKEFEHTLSQSTADQLSAAASAWARSETWKGLDVNPMDVIGDVLLLAAHWATLAERARPLYAWIESGS